MAKRAAKYETRTEQRIKDALLKLLANKPLADITVSELAREAHVSRSAFYEHFGNPDDVYDVLMAEISAEMSPLMSQVACSDGFKPAGKPFCALVNEAGDYASVVREPRFMESIIGQRQTQEGHDLYAMLVDAGYSPVQAKAVCSFQMSGCFSAVRSIAPGEGEWDDVRPVIDRFILGGIAACLAAKR